jgi:hypothetical protein
MTQADVDCGSLLQLANHELGPRHSQHLNHAFGHHGE